MTQALPDHSRDFDFQQGQWHVRHRRLKQRLARCTEWEEFDGSCTQFPVLGGNGNIEDNLLHLPGGAYRAVAIRSFDVASGTWAIWWLDQRAPHSLDVPVIGKFEHGTGTFLAEDRLEARPIRLRFLWLATHTVTPRWMNPLRCGAPRL